MKPEKLTDADTLAMVRLELSCKLAAWVASFHKITPAFEQTRQLRDDYNRSFFTWHRSLWTMAYKGLPASLDFQCIAAAGERSPEEKQYYVESAVQRYILSRWVYMEGLQFCHASDPEWHRSFADIQPFAKRFNDDPVFAALSEMKQRKPSKDSGGRMLKYSLLLFWIGGCLWTFTTDGVAAFLQAKHPRKNGKLYGNKTVTDCCRDLNLLRSSPPLFWGFSKDFHLQAL